MNSRIAFYRKYRPRNFSEIIGQKFVIKTLTNSIIKNKQSHAYIFSGPKGVGKTSIAKIFSKAVNCLDTDNGDCCNKCENCILIDKAQSIDVVELDAASNNGVGEVRNIIDTVGYLPSVLKFKVYIIDEAHMLSNAAWNAFLKLIEDPPKYLIFVFATTEPYKFPSTIISRCQRYNFLKLNNVELRECLLKISEKEDIKIDDGSLNKIAELSDGSLRDACSLLDQLDSYTNSNIKEKDIYEVFGLLDIHEKVGLLKSIWNGDFEKISNLIDEYEINGIDFYQLSIDLINVLYDKLVYERTKNISLLKFLPLNEVNFIEIQPKYIVKSLDIWQENLNKIKSSSNQKFFFKLSCFDSSRLFEFDSNVNLTNSSNVNKEEINTGKIVEMFNTTNSNPNTIVDNQPNAEVKKEEEKSIDFGIDDNTVSNEDKFDNSNFKKIKLDDIGMRVVQIKKDTVKEVNSQEEPDNFQEVSSVSNENQKINIVDSYIDDFIKVSHINKEEDINSVFGIAGKKTSKAKKPEKDDSKKIVEKPTNLTKKEETLRREQENLTVVKSNQESKEVVEEKGSKQAKKESSKKDNDKQEVKKLTNSDMTLFEFGDIEEINDESISPKNPNLSKNKDNITNEQNAQPSNVITSNEDKQLINDNPIEDKNYYVNEQKIENEPSYQDDYSLENETIENNIKDEILSEQEIKDSFLKIATNSDVKEKEKVSEIFKQIKDSIPVDKYDSIIKDLEKVIVVSKNGIAFLSNDDINIKNLNDVCTSLDFLYYIKNKFNKIYLVVAINKAQAIEIGTKIKTGKLTSANTKDVDISNLNEKLKLKKTAKDIAEDIFKDLIIDED